MTKVLQTFGWLLLCVLLVSGGGMSILIMTDSPFWVESPIRQHLIPLGHAHAGLLAIIMLIMGMYLEKVNLSEQQKKFTAIIYIIGTLLLPGGFILGVIRDGATDPGKEFIMVPIGGALIVVSFVFMFIGMLRAFKKPNP
jgi:hypothetical protein